MQQNIQCEVNEQWQQKTTSTEFYPISFIDKGGGREGDEWLAMAGNSK